MKWRPMWEHVFPWEHKNLLVVAFHRDAEGEVDVFRVIVGEHGALFYDGLLSLHEQGWIPYAWRIDDAPARDDVAYPPLRADYLTAEEEWWP